MGSPIILAREPITTLEEQRNLVNKKIGFCIIHQEQHGLLFHSTLTQKAIVQSSGNRNPAQWRSCRPISGRVH